MRAEKRSPEMFRKRVDRSHAAPEQAAATAQPDLPTWHQILDQYVLSAPSAQNALDLFENDWSSSLPLVFGLRAGPLPLFNDDRIKLVLQHIGSVKTFKILELGPLEGGHTYMLHEAGARVTAIEASSKAFLKCLVVKEILNLNRAHFLLGGFGPYLEKTNERFDLVLASGVLYHAMDPIELLESIARVTDKVAIWTHYWDADAVNADEKIARVFVEPPVDVQWRGHELRVHPRHYREALEWGGFCGGPDVTARWLERDGLMTVLGELGFAGVTVLEEEVDHVNGPAILLVAER